MSTWRGSYEPDTVLIDGCRDHAQATSVTNGYAKYNVATSSFSSALDALVSNGSDSRELHWRAYRVPCAFLNQLPGVTIPPRAKPGVVRLPRTLALIMEQKATHVFPPFLQGLIEHSWGSNHPDAISALVQARSYFTVGEALESVAAPVSLAQAEYTLAVYMLFGEEEAFGEWESTYM